ncbi:MAG: hypothetical protein M1828_001053 [Chrysothrix sp. TS-e1954]|nr:MAG: hypothetical protein M1828_001053 [Chrysothrix sp. TS-e1954]
MSTGTSPNLGEFNTMVLLLSLLRNVQDEVKRPMPSVQAERLNRSSKQRWHQFLDNLCWMCDSRRGGKAVTAIAVEKSPSNTLIFWIAANRSPNIHAVAHLEWVLEKLAQYSFGTLQQRDQIVLEMSATSLKFSTDRVKDYRRKLRGVLGKALNEHPREGDIIFGE